jgi:transposase
MKHQDLTLKTYKAGGVENLLMTSYKERGCQLSEAQLESLCVELEGGIYLTTTSVIDYVECKFEIQYTSSGMRDLLHRIGYVFKNLSLCPATQTGNFKKYL